MKSQPPHPRRHLWGGTTRVFLAEALILPTGLVTAAFLSRRLGPDGYGLFTLSATIVTWIEWSISSIFARATVKFVSEASNWQAVGKTVKRLHLAASCLAMVLLWVLAGPIAGLLNESILINYLRLFALDIPIFSLAHAHRNILVGLGGFGERAYMSVGRWLARLILIILLVELGLSVQGAILGSIGASVTELVISRFYVRLSLFRRSSFPARRLFGYAIPLFLFALSIHIYNKLDLIMLKALGGTLEQAGLYGAAQNLSIVPSIFAISFSPLLLSTLSRMSSAGNGHISRDLGRDALRVVIWLLPFAGMTAGAAPEIVVLIFGTSFANASPLLGFLIFAALAMVMISVTTAVLTAAGKPGWTFALTGPMVPLAILGHMLVIPKFGPIGAAAVTTFFSLLGALTTVFGVYRVWQILPPLATLMRGIIFCGAAFALAAFWHTPGLSLILKFAVVVVFILFAFLLSGEFSPSEIASVRMLLRTQSVAD